MSYQATAAIFPAAEVELVTRAVAGDRDAFATLYNDHRPEVYRYLVNRTRNRSLAEDLTQDTFLRALRRIDTFQHRPTTAGFVGWLCVIARNIYLDHLKLHRTTREIPTAEPFQIDTFECSAEESAIRSLAAVDTRRVVGQAMETLTPHQRDVVRLRHFEELTFPETAARLGKNVASTKTLNFRAMRKMQAVLAGSEVAK
ncbi:RNA polymerase sigma factor [Streptomyces sp. SID161]|uniref:sigma-70 family RNA polymerase sigma factor n=1 Tax=Streptomyces sp. SID161 TaxID=2690251 RepID=UPI00136953B9|nr:sigma-70 family RNA polymerase sigma factor [Streptomyces sp. SID161]MYW49879.1 sigma-70 family RNA polymerase sigma factor [Streptomyces sp. SID161]